MIPEFAYLPVVNGTKRPALKRGFTYDGFKPGERREPEFAQDNWQWGVVCARHLELFAIDVDDPAEYEDTMTSVIVTADAATVRRGDHYHVYVRCSCPRYPKQGPKRGHDIKARGFVVAAGSIHPSGTAYEATGTEPVPCTPELHDAIDADPYMYKTRNGYAAYSQFGKFTEFMSEQGWDSYADIPDETLGQFMLLYPLVGSMHQTGISRDDAQAHFERIAWSKDPGDPWTTGHFDTWWDSAEKKEDWSQARAAKLAELAWQKSVRGTGASAVTGDDEPDAWDDALETAPANLGSLDMKNPPRPEVTADAKPAHRFQVYKRHELKDIRRGAFLIEDWIPAFDGEAEVGYLASPSGHGKTFVALDIAGTLSTHRTDFHGYTAKTSVTATGDRYPAVPVLYVMNEGASGADQRMSAWESMYGDVMDVTVLTRTPMLSSRDDTDAIITEARKCGAGVIIIDTLHRSTTGLDENSAKDMGPVISALDRISIEARATVIVVHHTPKDGKGLRGTSALTGAASFIITTAKDGNRVTLSMRMEAGGKVKDGRTPGDLVLTLKDVDGTESAALWQDAKKLSASDLEVLRVILNEIDDKGHPGHPIRNADIVAKSTVAKRTVQKSLAFLESIGIDAIRKVYRTGASGDKLTTFAYQATKRGEELYVQAGFELPQMSETWKAVAQAEEEEQRRAEEVSAANDAKSLRRERDLYRGLGAEEFAQMIEQENEHIHSVKEARRLIPGYCRRLGLDLADVEGYGAS